MSVAKGKSAALLFRERGVKIDLTGCEIKLGSDEYKEVSSYTYLGVKLSQYLEWEDSID